MKVFLIGVGLIGGSFALDIKNFFSDAIVYGIDTDNDHLDKALALGIIDYKSVIGDIVNASIVIVAVPVDVTVKILPTILDLIDDECLVFDVGSTKQKICDAVSTHPKRRNYLATHPIAGTEFSGPDAAIMGLYAGKTNIICEIEKTSFKLQERAMHIFTSLRMRIRYMNPISHDKHIAYVSHLSHISSFMLGKTVMQKEKNEKDIFDMAGSGFASTVRLAKSSPAMWTPIFEHNKENVIETLEKYITNLIRFKKLMEKDDFTKVYDEMNEVNYIKSILKGIA